ncbi:MAG: hypothetical protein NTV49_04870 [Kiritimatiellaeota bacterium]|nr:hypothetical protein [Kiritimatiellota bacterium]
MKKFRAALVCAMLCAAAQAQSKVVVALMPLSSSDGLEAEPAIVSQVLQAKLSDSANVTLVERERLHQALAELKLGQQGLVTAASAGQLGKLVGARYFCSGSLSKSGDKIMAVAKVIEVETTLVKTTYAFLKNKEDAEAAGAMLAAQLEQVIARLEAERAERGTMTGDAKGAAQAIPADWKRPRVMVIIREMHVQHPSLIEMHARALIDPAGETEIIKRLLGANFRVIDSEYVHLMQSDQSGAKRLFGSLKTATQHAAARKADILLYGEALSERGAGLGDFEGCRGRIELKAVRTDNDEILLSDSAEGGATDLVEAVAGKKAIQQAANRLADTFLYSLAAKWNKK